MGAVETIFISAAELSGDRHAAELIRELRRLRPDARFVGVVGPQMRAAGCEAIDDLTNQSAMLLGGFGLAWRGWRLLRRLRRLWAVNRPHLAILVDSPALHLPMAKRVRAVGCPVLYYIAPQLWAWAPWRIGRLRRRVDRLAAILPFEEGYFRRRGVEARFVGHPLIEQLRADVPAEDAVRALRDLGRPIVACLPGSRRQVIEQVLPGQIEVARAIAARHPRAAFLFVAASEPMVKTIEASLDGERFTRRVVFGRNASILAAADLALCASGTAALEVAYHRVPMVIMYNGSKWGYRLVGRLIIYTPHLSLLNILAGREIVPEFMPYYTSTAPIAAQALDLLDNAPRRAAMQADFEAVVRSLGPGGATRRTAEMAVEMLNRT